MGPGAPQSGFPPSSSADPRLRGLGCSVGTHGHRARGALSVPGSLRRAECGGTAAFVRGEGCGSRGKALYVTQPPSPPPMGAAAPPFWGKQSPRGHPQPPRSSGLTARPRLCWANNELRGKEGEGCSPASITAGENPNPPPPSPPPCPSRTPWKAPRHPCPPRRPAEAMVRGWGGRRDGGPQAGDAEGMREGEGEGMWEGCWGIVMGAWGRDRGLRGAGGAPGRWRLQGRV